jgi:WD40 repeat protein
MPGREQSLGLWLGSNGSTTRVGLRSIAFSPQGRNLPPSAWGTVRIWDTSTGKPLTTTSGTSENFLRIGHSLLALIAALVGGNVSRRLYRRGRVQPTGSPAPPEPSAIGASIGAIP